MEVSETLTHLPLDFSVTMMNNIKIKHEIISKGELNNNNTCANSMNMILQQNNHQSSSAFKVVTPRKTDGKKILFNFFVSISYFSSFLFAVRVKNAIFFFISRWFKRVNRLVTKCDLFEEKDRWSSKWSFNDRWFHA